MITKVNYENYIYLCKHHLLINKFIITDSRTYLPLLAGTSSTGVVGGVGAVVTAFGGKVAAVNGTDTTIELVVVNGEAAANMSQLIYLIFVTFTHKQYTFLLENMTQTQDTQISITFKLHDTTVIRFKTFAEKTELMTANNIHFLLLT